MTLRVAFLINVSVNSVSGAVCNSPDLDPEEEQNCHDLELNKASFLLKVCFVFGKINGTHDCEYMLTAITIKLS